MKKIIICAVIIAVSGFICHYSLAGGEGASSTVPKKPLQLSKGHTGVNPHLKLLRAMVREKSGVDCVQEGTQCRVNNSEEWRWLSAVVDAIDFKNNNLCK